MCESSELGALLCTIAAVLHACACMVNFRFGYRKTAPVCVLPKLNIMLHWKLASAHHPALSTCLVLLTQSWYRAVCYSRSVHTGALEPSRASSLQT